MAFGRNDITKKYVTPPHGHREIMILTDNCNSMGIMALADNIIALTSKAVVLLQKAFVGQNPLTIQDCINECNDSGVYQWLIEQNNDQILTLTDRLPKKDFVHNTFISEGEIINNSCYGSTGCLPQVKAKYSGSVCVEKINETVVFFYTSCEALNNVCIIEDLMSVSAYGEYGGTLYPKPLKASVGANCASCGGCSSCGSCGGCVLCDEVNFGVGAILSLNSISSISVSSGINPLMADNGF